MLQEIYGEQNINPNLHRAAIESLHQIKNGVNYRPQQTDGIDYETQSITSQKYNGSAIGEMNNEELEKLAAKNQKRIADLDEEKKKINQKSQEEKDKLIKEIKEVN